jgi:hypothetical protein
VSPGHRLEQEALAGSEAKDRSDQLWLLHLHSWRVHFRLCQKFEDHMSSVTKRRNVLMKIKMYIFKTSERCI